MALYKPDCDSNDCELPSGQATPSILARGVACEAARGVGYFRFLPRLAWFPASSRSNAAVTAWFTSLRTFGDSCAWLGVGRLTADLKYRRILISAIDVIVLMKTRVAHASKGAWSRVILFIAYSFPCDSFDCEL